MSRKRIYELRIYEGEWVFGCEPPCRGCLIEYSFDEYDGLASGFLPNTGMHATERCHLCSGPLEWAGYSGDMPISDSLVSLLRSNHYMAATVMLASITENLINNLLWAAFVDNGIDRERANAISNGRISRADSLRMIA